MKAAIILFLFALLTGCKNKTPLAYYVEGVEDPQISLNGRWEINSEPEGEYKDGILPGGVWREIQVPGECMMQGFAIQHDKPFFYRKYFIVPVDYDNKIIRLRFDGVYSYARVWVNGHYLRDHSGGFTRWECEITPFVRAGDTACLVVEVTDKSDEISFASGYAKHPIGGILRDVSLLAYPGNYPENISINTCLDEFYENAVLEINGEIVEEGQYPEIHLELSDPLNRIVLLENSVIQIDQSGKFRITNQVVSPFKWDAEHPYLYRLKIIFMEDLNIIWYKVFKIGFREIEIQGNRLLINGRPVKLRGACRHDIHPLLGRVSTPDYELKDVILAKEANINFIRTSHYPPTDHFLSLCDEYGLYVEDESAVCFVGTHRTAAYQPGATENSQDYTERYLSQLEEIVQNHRNHPSVIIWSLGNESSYGMNFKKSYEWVKKCDPSRPVIFSYPGRVPDSIRNYDILSMHYPGIHGNLEQYGKITNFFGYPDMPVIFDEWAHVPCYNNFTIQEDPNIRDFWGISLDSMWQNLFMADAGTGGAIWGMIDETFMLPDTLSGFGKWWGVVDENVIPSGYSGTAVGYGEWGIIDTWRRKKPEFWGTKKAYSPVRLLYTHSISNSPDDSITIPVMNRFDHTNLNELKITMSYNGSISELDPFNLEPHGTGTLTLPPVEWEKGRHAIISFYDSRNNLIESYSLQNELSRMTGHEKTPGDSISFSEDENRVTVYCENDTRIIVDKFTGLITSIHTPVDTFVLSGPYLNLRTRGRSIAYTYNEIKDAGDEWNLDDFSVRKTENAVVVTSRGHYSDCQGVVYNMSINSDKEIRIRYQLEKIPDEYIREIGIKWILEDTFDSLYWDRRTYWSNYPDDYLSPLKGKVALYNYEIKKYREEPVKNWVYDTKSFYYDGTDNEKPESQLTNIAKATKEDVWDYGLIKTGHRLISVVGNGETDCRVSKADKKMILFINNRMDYVDLNWGNYQRNIKLGENYEDEVILRIEAL